MSNTKPITFDRVIRILAIVAVAVILIWLVNLLKNVLLPFCVACLVAYMLEPVVAFNQQWTHTRGRGLAVFLTLLQVSFVVGILCYFCVPSVIEEIHQIEIMLKNTAGRTVDMPFIPAEIHKYVDRYLNPEVIGQLLQDGRLTSLLDKGSSLVGATIDFLMHTLEWLLTFIYIIFIMLDYKRLMHGFRRLVPPRMRKVAYRVGDDIKHNMNRYFRSQALIAACAAVLLCGFLNSGHTAGHSPWHSCRHTLHDTLFPVCHPDTCGRGLFHKFDERRCALLGPFRPVRPGLSGQPVYMRLCAHTENHG